MQPYDSELGDAQPTTAVSVIMTFLPVLFQERSSGRQVSSPAAV